MRLLVSTILLLLISVVPAWAQNAAVDEGLKGMSPEEVLERFGKPDRSDESVEERQIWYYGKSMILFNNGKVSAWSNTGELQGRNNLSTIRDKRRVNSFAANWVNVWTPIDRLSANDVIQSLMTNEGKAK